MNQLLLILRPILDRFAASSGTSKTTLAGLLLTVIVLAIWIGQSSFQNEMIPVLDRRQLSPEEITSIQLAFGQDGLNGYEIVDSMINVPKRSRDEYLKSIVKHQSIQLDDDKSTSSSINPFMTHRQQNQLILDKKKKRLRDLLVQLPGIEEVWVEYNEVKSSEPFRPIVHRAAITFRSRDDQPISSATINSIRAQTRGTFPGLNDSSIELIDIANGLAIGSQSTYSESQQVQFKVRQTKEELKKKIEQALSPYTMLDVKVEVNLVESDGDFYNGRQKNKTPAQFASQPQEVENNQTTSNKLVGANGQVRIGTENHKREMLNTSSVTPSNLDSYFSPRVTISVSESQIRKSLIDSDGNTVAGWNEVQMSFEETRNEIEQIVSSLLPAGSGNVDVILNPDTNTVAVGLQKQQTSTFQNWFRNNWKTVVLILFGVCALLILRPNKTAEEK